MLRKLLIITILFVASTASLNAQCKSVKKALKSLNDNKIDSAESSINKASRIIQENGLETVSEKCLARYYYAKGSLFFLRAKKAKSPREKLKYFEQSEESFHHFKQLPESPSELEKMVKSNSVSLAVAYMNLGVQYYDSTVYDSAYQFISKGVLLKKEAGIKIKNQEYYNLLVTAKWNKNYKEALDISDTLLNRKQSSSQRVKYLSQKFEILTLSGKKDEAKALLGEMKEESENNTGTWFSELQVYLDHNEDKMALQVLNMLTAEYPDRYDLLIIKGQLHYKQNELPLSISAYNTVLSQDNKNIDALFGLGVIHVQQGNDFIERKKRSMNTSKTELLYNEARKSFQLAAQYLGRVVKIKEDHRLALLALRGIYQSLGDPTLEQQYDNLLRKL